MGHGFKHGASGAPLNFKVVGGTTEPTNPKENMIWVNTDQKITEWAFAVENPYIHTSDELYTAVGVTSGHYLDASGKEVASTSYKTTAMIDLPDGTYSVAIAASSTDSGVPHHAFYNAEGELISTVLRKTGTAAYDVPSGAKSVRISVRSDDAGSLIATYTTAKEGAVWFPTGTHSPVEFNAVKKNRVQVYPLSARQHISGAWVTKTPKSCQDGTWGEWIYILFDKTEGINNLSGWAEYKSDYATSITVNSSGNLQIGMSSHSYNAVVNKTAIDTTPYSVMTFTVVSKNISDNLYIGLSAKTSGMGMGTGHFVVRSTNPTAGTHTIDISALSGVHYFAVSLHAKVSNAVVLSSVKFS